MKRTPGRPVGIVLVAALVAINGAASLVDAVVIAEFTPGGLLQAIVAAMIGLALLHRAYGLWSLRRSAWLITLALLGLRSALGVIRLIVAPSSTVEWINLALNVVTLLYLLQPGVRELFSGRKADV